MMMREIPLPMPRSVILSPSHMTNMEPARRMMVEIRLNEKLLHPSLLTATKASPGIWLWIPAM